MTTAADSAQKALDALSLMVLEDGHRWHETAAAYQWANARAILSMDGPVRQHWIELPRGARKTTDLAGLLLAILYAQAPAMARLYVGASDEEQAAELIDAAHGLIERTPELQGQFRPGELEITSTRTGATVTALAADASAMGKRAWMIVLDEVANWPETRKARRFWGVLTSGNRKLADCRTVVITNSGDPAHWAWKRREVARQSSHWRFTSLPGPLPWLTATDLEILRENAETYSEYERLHLNRWVTAEDRLATPEDLAACCVLPGPLPPQPGVRYVVSADLGSTNDRAVVDVLHAETTPGGRHVVLDRTVRWQGSKTSPVPLSDVRDTIAALARDYGHAEVVIDPWQAHLIAEELRARGIRVTAFNFNATSVGRLALALHQGIRNHRLSLPADQDLIDELTAVRLRKNALGVYRLDHDSGGHDDQAIALALGVVTLTGQDGGAEAWIEWATRKAEAALNPPQPEPVTAAKPQPGQSPDGTPATRPDPVPATPKQARDEMFRQSSLGIAERQMMNRGVR